jgi:hypothetical protein
VICRFLIFFGFVLNFSRPRIVFPGRGNVSIFFPTLFLFSICLGTKEERKKTKWTAEETEIELTTPVNCVVRVCVKKQNDDVRVLNDVVCLTICVGIYDEPERKEKEETREKTNFYILYKYIYRDAIQCLF